MLTQPSTPLWNEGPEAVEVCPEGQVSLLGVCLGIWCCSGWSQLRVWCSRPRGTPLSSSSCVAAEERVEHGLLHALLVLPTPCDHCPITVGRVQMVAIAGKRKAYDRLI